MRETEEDGPIVKLVNRMVEDAYSRGASELHVEPREPAFSRVLYLAKGALEERMRIPWRAHSAVVNRLKIMAGLSPFPGPERGRIDFRRFSRRELELELSLLFARTPAGAERVVAQLIPPSEERESACPYERLVVVLLEEAHLLGGQEVHWLPSPPRVERLRDGQLELRLELSKEAYRQHLRVLRSLAGLEPYEEEGWIELTPLSPQRLELGARLTASWHQGGETLVAALQTPGWD